MSSGISGWDEMGEIGDETSLSMGESASCWLSQTSSQPELAVDDESEASMGGARAGSSASLASPSDIALHERYATSSPCRGASSGATGFQNKCAKSGLLILAAYDMASTGWIRKQFAPL